MTVAAGAVFAPVFAAAAAVSACSWCAVLFVRLLRRAF